MLIEAIGICGLQYVCYCWEQTNMEAQDARIGLACTCVPGRREYAGHLEPFGAVALRQRGWHTPARHDTEERWASVSTFGLWFCLRHFSALMEHHMTLSRLCDRQSLGDGGSIDSGAKGVKTDARWAGRCTAR